VPMMHLTRPGANSSTLCSALASTDACRVNGLVTAGKIVMWEVCMAAAAMVTKTSRQRSWLSRMPAPAKPAASTSRTRRAMSCIGAVPGMRSDMCTGTGIVTSIVADPDRGSGLHCSVGNLMAAGTGYLRHRHGLDSAAYTVSRRGGRWPPWIEPIRLASIP
jgi:hypothetical protein